MRIDRNLTKRAGVILLTTVTQAVAQQTVPPAAADARPAFEVATIKPAAAGRDGGRVRTLPGGQTFIASNVALKNLIMTAYSVRADQISGGPGWTSADGYDIEAKAGQAVGPAELLLMLQSLLADRFKLILRDEKKVQPVYALILEKAVPNLKRNKDGSESLLFPTGVGQYRATDVSMPYLAWTLSRFPDVGRVVIDRTGLPGGYDFDLRFTMTPVGQNPADAPPEAGPSVFTALKEQLGLKLEPAREAVDFFIIDRAERPSEN
jgi:uncharacterized protein (TIGR03435 family)